jgi:hypothetical protein
VRDEPLLGMIVADVNCQNVSWNERGNDSSTTKRHYTGKALAGFIRYTDGKYVLKFLELRNNEGTTYAHNTRWDDIDKPVE